MNDIIGENEPLTTVSSPGQGFPLLSNQPQFFMAWIPQDVGYIALTFCFMLT